MLSVYRRVTRNSVTQVTNMAGGARARPSEFASRFLTQMTFDQRRWRADPATRPTIASGHSASGPRACQTRRGMNGSSGRRKSPFNAPHRRTDGHSGDNVALAFCGSRPHVNGVPSLGALLPRLGLHIAALFFRCFWSALHKCIARVTCPWASPSVREFGAHRASYCVPPYRDRPRDLRAGPGSPLDRTAQVGRPVPRRGESERRAPTQ
jgi:hypothetical protein